MLTTYWLGHIYVDDVGILWVEIYTLVLLHTRQASQERRCRLRVAPAATNILVPGLTHIIFVVGVGVEWCIVSSMNVR